MFQEWIRVNPEYSHFVGDDEDSKKTQMMAATLAPRQVQESYFKL